VKVKKPKKNKYEDTQKAVIQHIDTLRAIVFTFIDHLFIRASTHDRSKLFEPEISVIHENLPRLKKLKYQSPEYKRNLAEIKPMLDHHYANNMHHIEHHQNGIADMDLVSIVEMFCDWNAAVLQHESGNIEDSIKENKERYNLSPEMELIFLNTLKYFKEFHESRKTIIKDK
jgi:hypothetical protein